MPKSYQNAKAEFFCWWNLWLAGWEVEVFKIKSSIDVKYNNNNNIYIIVNTDFL
jgi:hypothetical protein